jgi:Mor family transcriptional regulator
MKVAEIVFLGRELLKMASENDVKVNDWKHVDMYKQYVNMRKMGMKYRATICELATTYRISKSNVERIIRRFNREC